LAQEELLLNPVGLDKMALPENLIEAVKCCFRKSDNSWLTWDEVTKVLLEQNGITPSFLKFVTPAIQLVFGMKKSNRKGFALEIYFNCNKSKEDLIESYVKSRLEVDGKMKMSLMDIAKDFYSNNPSVNIANINMANIMHLLACSIKINLDVKKNQEKPPTWPICFRKDRVVLQPITRGRFQDDLDLAIANSLKEVQSLPLTLQTNRQRKRLQNVVENCEESKKISSFYQIDDLEDMFISSSDEDFLLPSVSDTKLPVSVSGLSVVDLRLVLLSMVPYIGGHYPPRIPKDMPNNESTLQFGVRINGVGAFFSFDGKKHLIHDSSAFGIVNPCPPAIQCKLMSWFFALGFRDVPLSQIAAQLVVRWKDQGAHIDDPCTIVDIATLDIASAGGLQIVSPPLSITGSYLWCGVSENSLRHNAFCGRVPGSDVTGRISLVFRKYCCDLPPFPESGKVAAYARCNQILSDCVHKEIMPHFTAIDSSVTHYELCAKLLSVAQSLLCLQPGGYCKREGYGCAPSSNSVFAAMTMQEKEATIPGLSLGEVLPESFYIPKGSFDSLWTMGFHRRMMGTTVHSNEFDGLISIAIRVTNIDIVDCCPLFLPIEETVVQKNLLCKNRCCAAILLSPNDQKSNIIKRFLLEIRHFVYLYVIHQNSMTTAQRVKYFVIHDLSYLILTLSKPPSIPDGLCEKCSGVERNSSLIYHASTAFPNGIIVRSYQNQKKPTETNFVGYVVRDIIQYAQCNGFLINGNTLCEACVENQRWLKNHLYESN